MLKRWRRRWRKHLELAIEALRVVRAVKRVDGLTDTNGVAKAWKALETAWSALDGNGLGRCPQ